MDSGLEAWPFVTRGVGFRYRSRAAPRVGERRASPTRTLVLLSFSWRAISSVGKVRLLFAEG